jgi:hypothetical protein
MDSSDSPLASSHVSGVNNNNSSGIAACHHDAEAARAETDSFCQMAFIKALGLATNTTTLNDTSGNSSPSTSINGDTASSSSSGISWMALMSRSLITPTIASSPSPMSSSFIIPADATLDYSAFAKIVVLHPLLVAFFRLDQLIE